MSEEDEQTRAGRAIEAYQLADFESAEREFAQLYQETGRPEYHWNRANALLRLYRYDEAKEIYRQFVGTVPSSAANAHVDALEGYFMASERMGDADLGIYGS